MIHTTCYLVDEKVDGYISSKCGYDPQNGKIKFSPTMIASLRGLYDEYAKSHNLPTLIADGVRSADLTDEQLEDIRKKLLDFRTKIRLRNLENLSKTTKHLDRAYTKLKRSYSLHERTTRVNFLAALFSQTVDSLTIGHNIDRQAVVNGFRTVYGERVGGEFSILEAMYNEINRQRGLAWRHMQDTELSYEEYKKEIQAHGYTTTLAPNSIEEYRNWNEHKFNEYTKILENWDALIPFVLKTLVAREGVRMGIKKEYVSSVSADSYGDNDIAEKWDISEAKRDGWQENSDLQSAFGSVGQQVRRILATIPKIELTPLINNEGIVTGYEKRIAVDDLGITTFINPVRAHQMLIEYLRGVQLSDEMMARLVKPDKPNEAKVAWMDPIVKVLRSNPQAKTQFFVDFAKGFQPYSIMFEDEEKSIGKIRYIKTRILNKPKNILKDFYETSFVMSPNLSTQDDSTSVQHVNGEVNWKNLAELRNTVLQWVAEDITQTGILGKQKVYGIHTSPLLTRDPNATININGKEVKVTYDLKRAFLSDTFYALGHAVDMDTIDSILNSNDIYTVREQLEQLFDKTGKTGILYSLHNDDTGNGKTELQSFKALSAKNNADEKKEEALRHLDSLHVKFRYFYGRTKNLKGGKKFSPIKEHIGKLLDVINKYEDASRIESRVRYNGNTMYSYVAPSYLSDRLGALQSYVMRNDKKGLLEMLQQEYLNDPYFVDDEYIATNGEKGKILNSWLANIVDACKQQEDLLNSAASVFSYERDLGTGDKKFEDFTTREHAVDMLIHFFADENQQKGYGGKGKKNISKKLSALYPVFILGDAGVSKYIRAPRVSTPTRVDRDGNVLDEADADKTDHIEYRFDNEAEEQILESFWNIYVQEKRRMVVEEAMATVMYANGKPVHHTKGEFSILTFLNPTDDAYNSKYNITGHESDKDYIKKVIRQYLDDASINGIEHIENGRKIVVPSFKQRMETLKVLETTKYGNNKESFNQLSSIATPQNINSKIREFFWNTKLATAQQLQIMTIDPSFYHGTKDLQKRYKEIHAPGSILDTSALDFNNRLYSEDGLERVVYFNDIAINSETANPEFMETILRIFAKDNADVDTAIKEGILTPQENGTEDGKKKETIRQNKLRELLGDNYSIYETYTKNTLTDGQGYRTLTSYRKVMGMAGKWTRNMEKAYNRIMEIRKNHEKDGKDVTAEERKEIGSYALVLQPIKPYMFTHEKIDIQIAKKVNGQTVMGADGKPVMINVKATIPVQHKYAEALIIPELMPKGSKLRDLGLWMDSHNVDMVGSTKIAKVGCFGQTNLNDVTDEKSLNEAMKRGIVHELQYRDYRIQTNVPEHINSSQLFGTQVRKLIMSGLLMNEDYSSYVGGHLVNLSTSEDKDDANRNAKLTGRNLLALYNSLICSNIFDSYSTFENNANDIQKLSDLLMQSTVGSMRESMDNIFSYVVTGDEEGFKKFVMPLFEGGLEHDSAALILSTFKKIVNKQQISGGSAVQVSAFGINGYDEDGGLRYVQDSDNPSNILYAEIEMPFDRTFVVDVKNADGSTSKQKINLSYEKYCNLDGTLIPTGEALEKGTAEWKKYQSYTYKEIDGKLVSCDYRDPQAKVYKPLIEKDFPDILSILAYRIPTERDYSMINCRIKRFTSKMAGGTLKVPPQGTSIAGFDFDIDKLYFMQREYHMKENSYKENYFSEVDKNQIWRSFYDANPEIREALEYKRGLAELKDPNITKKRVLPSGRVMIGHLTKLNSYWDDAEIEKKFGKNKQQVFAEYAQLNGIMPTRNLNENLKFEEYDFSKSPEENTRSARNNLLISLMQARLSDPETAKERYNPGGFTNARKAARFMRELDYGDLSTVTSVSNGVATAINLDKIAERQNDDTDPEPSFDPTDPYTILRYNQQNQVAGKLIGIFANESTNHAFASSMDVFELKDPIAFCGHSYKDLLHKGADSWQINKNVSEFLAASVDAVKDPVLSFMNLNTITADAGAVLARLGYNMKEIALLFKQPIVVWACEESFNTGKRINTVFDEKRKQFLNQMTGKQIHNNVPLTSDILALQIVNNRIAEENGKTLDNFFERNAETQLAVLDLMQDLLKVSQDVSDFVLNTKFTASNAVSSTLGGMYAQQYKVKSYLDRFPKDDKHKGSLSYNMIVAQDVQGTGLFEKPIEDREENLSLNKKEYLHRVRFNPFAYEQTMYDANKKVLKLLSKYYPYETSLYKGVRDRMNDLARYGNLSEDDINDIHSNLPVALLAKQTQSLFNGEAVHKIDGKPTNLTNREYYRERFAKDLQEQLFKDDRLLHLKIFRYMSPKYNTVVTGEDPDTGEDIIKDVCTINMQDIGGLDADTKEEIRESWAYLMEKDEDGEYKNEDYAELGRDLFMYCFYQLGFDFSPISFMHLAPTAVKENIKVERAESLPLKSFDTINYSTEGKPSNDVLVWSNSVSGAFANSLNFDVRNRSVENTLMENGYRLPDNLTVNDVRKLIFEARKHPELRFKIDRTLTQEEFDLFTLNKNGWDVPGNIYFSSDTLNTVSQESKERVSYGKDRTYQEFLNEILDGKENSVDIDEYAQMFILNHLDNQRFVMSINKSNEGLKNILNKAVKDKNGNITIDVSSFDNDADRPAVNSLVKINKGSQGTVEKATWAPCLEINGSYYLAQSGGNEFNVNSDTRMTYIKVEPWGTSKTITYDGNKKLAPSMRYQTSLDAEPQRDKNYIPSEDNSQNKDDIKTENPNEREKGSDGFSAMRAIAEEYIFDQFVKANEKKFGKMLFEEKESVMKGLKTKSMQDLNDTIEAIREACKDGDGVLMLDDEGNLMEGC